ncbi:MAG: PAS domain S-box protein [Proteobacteria bacterium]|nr:PAS domain S-box protein [Pseudomonadota bacterium]
MEPERFAVSFLDVTDRRRAETAAQEVHARLTREFEERTAERDRLWRNSQDLLLIARFDAKIVAVNPAWTKVLGWSEAELVGASFVDFVHPEDLEATMAEAAGLSAEGRTTMQFQNRYRRKDGGWVWLSWAVSSHSDLFHAVARDVTAEKQAAVELELAQEQLRQSQKMEAIGHLTGGIAHDFNNMLAVVIGSLDLLGRRLEGEDARIRRYVDSAMDGARRAALLTQRLLAFSRQQPLRPEMVDPNKLVAGMSDLLRHSLGADIRLETVLAGGLWRTSADANQLENVLLNLAVNARDAMPGGGRLTIETQNAHLDERYAAAHSGVFAGQYVLIAVSDTGTGMSEDVIAKAFDPFFTTKDVGKGTGLGLSQVYGFLRQTGGHVKIYSEPGQGTTVKVYLPRLSGSAGEEAPDVDAAELALGVQQDVVLVVEDDAAVRQITSDALSELGYRVLEADGAAAGLRSLDAHPEVALLFTDVVMPDVNGRQLADEARRRRPDLKVLFTTGYTRNAVVHNGVLDQGVELIGKPFTVEELAAKVRSILDSPAEQADFG